MAHGLARSSLSWLTVAGSTGAIIGATPHANIMCDEERRVGAARRHIDGSEQRRHSSAHVSTAVAAVLTLGGLASPLVRQESSASTRAQSAQAAAGVGKHRGEVGWMSAGPPDAAPGAASTDAQACQRRGGGAPSGVHLKAFKRYNVPHTVSGRRV